VTSESGRGNRYFYYALIDRDPQPQFPLPKAAMDSDVIYIAGIGDVAAGSSCGISPKWIQINILGSDRLRARCAPAGVIEGA
jgi:hypothetical protein